MRGYDTVILNVLRRVKSFTDTLFEVAKIVPTFSLGARILSPAVPPFNHPTTRRMSCGYTARARAEEEPRVIADTFSVAI
jgi:hypothetical protein